MSEYQQAVTALVAVIEQEQHLDESLTSAVSPLAQQIAYGACRHFYFYHEVLDLLLDKPLPAKHLDLQLLAVAGLYSIDHLHRPAHASVNRVVDTTKSLKKAWAKGLINAVLRRYGREKDSIYQKVSESARSNHPEWLIEHIKKDWPDEPGIFESNNQQAPMTLRVNEQRLSRSQYLELLTDNNIEAREGGLSSSALTLNQAMAVNELPGFAEGLVSVQDEAPQLTPGFMNLFDGAKVLDACAAPGGKTCHLLEACPTIALTAIDRDRKRVHRIDENLERLSLEAKVLAIDLMAFKTEEKFDRVLLDVPCSATGIIRRHPDIKLLREPDDVAKLASIQRELLDKAFDLLAIGGELLYSTCSILRQENDEVILNFLADTPDATLNLLSAPHCDSARQTPQGVQLLPTMTGHDGFYYASIRKGAA